MSLTITSMRLRQLRMKRNLSQQDVADFLGITRTAYNKYENGSIQPTRTLKRLAKFFSVSTDFILGVDTADFPTVLLDKSVENHVKKKKALSQQMVGF